jgi:hypothetical protein
MPQGIGGVTSQSSNANGCGTPSHWSFPAIPDFPFREACNSHDICYSTFTAKSTCDNNFRDFMNRIANNITGGNVMVELTTGAYLHAMAQAYYGIVKTASNAVEAYCEGKGTECESINGEYGRNGATHGGAIGNGNTYVFIGGTGTHQPGSGASSCYITTYNQVCTTGGCNYWTESQLCN